MTQQRQDYSHTYAAPAMVGDRDAWELAASVANDGLWYFDAAECRLHLAPRTMELLGYQASDAQPNHEQIEQHLHAADRPVMRRAMAELLRGDRARAELEVRLIAVSGETRWTRVRIRSRRDASGRVLLIAGSLADIDHSKRGELALREESRRDVLTGLPNRLALAQRLTARIARADGARDPGFAVLYLDLDRFKIINDSLGHATGDAMLIEAAARIASVLGPQDLLARVGGDEFVVVLDEVTDEHEVHRIAGAIHAVTRPAMPLGDREVLTTLSIGIRVSDATESKPADLLRDADLAMYQAKRHGGARTVSFDDQMYQEMVARHQTQSELQHALARNELRVAYQPVFDLRDRRLCGFEALVRWQHPTRGCLNATSFVSEAMENGFIVQIGRWMLNEICSQLADWRVTYPNAMPFTVTLNLSDREVMDPEFAAAVEDALRKHGVPANYLTLEMTEGAMTASGEHTITVLRRLRSQGVNIQMDGFGRDSSSLAALRRMPVSAIKIDRSFVAGIATDDACRAIVATINGFACALGLDVIAEGVETRAQADALAEIGNFRYAQGHHFGPPAGELEVEELLLAR